MFKTNKENLSAHLQREIGIKSSDFVWLHSGVVGLGLLERGIQTITDAFCETLSEGALFIPTFSYSWCKNELFDPSATECRDMGAYASRAWKTPGFVRSGNPNFSVSALSNHSNGELIKRVFSPPSEQTCFGEESVFGRMRQLSRERNGYIILLGGAHSDVVFRTTFLHYVEEKVGVPYRYIKFFHNPDKSGEYLEQYVRFFSKEEYVDVTESVDIRYDFPIREKYEKLGHDLVEEGILIQAPFGYSTTRAGNIQIFCDWLEIKLRKDPEYLLK